MCKNRGFTLVELLVALAVVAIIIGLAAPSFRSAIEMKRLRGINSQVVTDMQYARGEAAAKGLPVRVSFESNPQMTCYTIFTAVEVGGGLAGASPCDCRLGPGAACANAGRTEIRTVQIPSSLGVAVTVALNPIFGFSHVTGGLFAAPQDLPSAIIAAVEINTALDASRQLNTVLNRAGRPTVCKPIGMAMPETDCPPLPP